jgi:hypothetical protein
MVSTGGFWMLLDADSLARCSCCDSLALRSSWIIRSRDWLSVVAIGARSLGMSAESSLRLRVNLGGWTAEFVVHLILRLAARFLFLSVFFMGRII